MSHRPSSTTTSDGRLARTAGVLFVLTFLTSIPALLLYDPVLNHAGYVLGAGADTRVALGAALELLLIVANIGTAVALFPLLRRQSEGLALGFVAARIIESTFIAVGIVSVLAVVSLRQDAAGADAGTLATLSSTLVSIHDWTFLLGPGFVVGIGNGMILGYLMYRSGLVPPRMAVLGLVGGPLLSVSGLAVLLGAFDAGSAPQLLATVPEILWEGSLGIYLSAKGLRRSGRTLAPAAVPA